jgi:hypothetical protein
MTCAQKAQVKLIHQQRSFSGDLELKNQSQTSAQSVFFTGQFIAFKNSGNRNSISPEKATRRGLARIRGIAFLATALILLGFSSGEAQAQTLQPDWNQQSPATSPSARFATAMAYDSAHGQTVLFSGLNASNDTWLWNGTNWTQASPATNPSARSAHAMAYDAAHGQVVMFGGAVGSTRVNETWLWNGTNWTQASPATNPPARNGAAMTYDPVLGKVVLFGGVSASGFLLGDIWQWDGTNWTNATPGSGPLARDLPGLAYDAALGRVVLFGGMDTNGFYDNDTWQWDGTSWTQSIPATPPPARYGPALEFNAALGQLVMFGGYNGSTYLADTWTFDGTNWTEQSPATGPSARTSENAIVYDTARQQLVMFGGYDGSSQFNDTWEFGLPGNFGNINVCPSGQSTPAPCSASFSLTYTFAVDTTINSINVLTQGTPGLDFAQANGGNCSGTISAGNSCTLNVTFTPVAPGLRTGAVNILSGGTLVATSLLYGVGQGPAVAFGPGTQSALIGTGGLSAPRAVAVDAAGDVFVGDSANNRVVKLPAGGAPQTTVGSGLNQPWGVAVDGAGDLFIGDAGNNRVVEVTHSGVQTTVPTSGLNLPRGVAVDGAGDLFIADAGNNRVVEIPAGCTAAACQITVASGLSNTSGVAADGAGDVFIVTSTGQLVEVPAGCTTAACQTLLANGFTNSRGVAVDAAGDVFIAENGGVAEIPAGCVTTACQTTVGSGLTFPVGVAVDSAGDLFVSDSNDGQLDEVNRSQVPTLQFDTTYVGFISDDSPRSILVQNIGNQTLSAVFPGLLIQGSNFSQVPGSGTPADCTSTFSLTPGSDCNLSVSFSPQSAAIIGDVLTLTDNTLNASSAQQQVFLYGTGINQPVTFTLAGSGTGDGFVQSSPTGINCSVLAGVASGSCSASFPGGTGISLEEVPNPGYTFAGWGGACASSGTSQFCNITVNTTSTASATFVLNSKLPLNVTGLGTGTGNVQDVGQLLNCNVVNGSGSGACTGLYNTGSVVTLTAAAATGSVFTGWGGACTSYGVSPQCIVTVNQASDVSVSFVNINFGNVNVCPAGQSTPAPCSETLTLNYTLASTKTIGAIDVLTQGATGLDFTLGSGSTCSGAIAQGNSCTVSVTFTPRASGLRAGAVELFDNSANLIATLPVYGIGQAPLIAFGPGSQTIVPVTGLHYPVGTAVDALGNLYIADYVAANVTKITPGGIQTTVPATGLIAPIGVAVDGAGNLFIADLNLPNAVEITPAGIQTNVGSGLARPIGIAVDGAGNVYIAEQNNAQVAKITPSGVQSALPLTGLNQPNGVTVDASGNVFVSDSGNNRVVEYTFGGLQIPVPITGLNDPYGMATDAAGNLYVADGFNHRVVQFATGTGVVASIGSGLNFPSGVSVDAAGNVYIGDQGASQVVKVSRLQAPALSFATTNAGVTSADSPQAVTVQNIGNQPLTGSIGLNLGSSFSQSAAPDCSSKFPLAPGAVCSESFSFTPQSATFFSGTATFTDNNLNIATGAQTITLSGTGAIGGVAGTVAVPNVVGQVQAAAATPITGAGLAMGTVTTTSSETVPSGSIISQNPAAGTQVNVGSAVNLLVSTGLPQPLSPNPLVLNNNYFVTGDYVSSGVTLRGTGTHGMATGNITIPTYASSPTQGVPDGADIVEAYLYWETLENTASASSTSGTFNHYAIVGQQIGTDRPGYVDGALTGTIRAYRAEVNAYLPVGANGVRFAAGTYSVSLPDSGGSTFPLTEGASLVLVYRVLSPNFPLKSVVIYDGSALPVGPAVQVVQGFYDAVGGASGTGKSTNLFASGGSWNNSVNSVTLGQSNQYTAPLNTSSAYAAVILSTPVNNSDNDGILDAWKAGPAAGDFHAGQPGYYDVKTNSWVSLPGAKHGQKDLFVQLDYMCGAVLANGSCDPTQENLFPSPDANGNDPLAMVQQAFAASGVQLHLQIGNAVPESTCTDDPTNPSALCQFPGQPGVISWKNGLEFSKLWPRNFASCAAGGDCTTRFPYGQKDSYHYVLFGHSLAIPAYNTRYGTLASINVVNGVTTIVTADRGTGISACPSRITLSGVLGNPSLNGVYNTASCSDTKTITVATPGVPNWSYPNSTLPEPVIGLTSGTITSISGYSDLGGADSAVTLGLWLTAPNQDMSKRANVLAGTLFHEIGHTLGLSHGGLYYDTPNSYVPTFEANCKPNYQSIMNYLFQLDGVGPNQAIAFSNQTLTTLNESTAGSVTQLTDLSNAAATFPTSAWYVPFTTGSLATPATRHCDGTPLVGDAAYRVDASIAPITPAWANGQDINFIGTLQTKERGFNDLGNLDLRQIGATGGEFASLASVLSFGSSAAPLNIAAGGNVALGSGGTIALGSGGNVTLGSGGNVTLGSGGTITLGSGGNVTLGSGGNVTLGSGGTITPGSSGNVTLGSGGNVTLGSGGTITLGSGGTITLGSGGTVALGSGGTIVDSTGTVTVPSVGGSYPVAAGGTITLGSGGNVTLGSGGNVTLGSGGTIALGSGGNVTLGSGGNVTLGSGGTITLGSGGTIALGSGGNVTLGSGGTIALGSGGTVTLGSGGNVTLGSGGTVTLGSGGNVALGSGGNITLGSGGSASLGAGGTVTLGSGGNVTLGSGGTVTLGSGGNVTLGSGGTITLGSGGNITLGSGGTITLGSGGTVTDGGVTTSYGPGSNNISVGAGGTVTLGSGGNITLGSGGNVTLGSGGNITLGSGGNIALGSGGTITLGSGGNITLGSGGVVTLGSGGSVTPGNDADIPVSSNTVTNTATQGSGGPLSNELTYETANSVVRVPTAPTETPTPTGVRINWKAPAFGVVQTYTIYRSSNGATPIVIGSVSGVNGNPPATEFTDTNPDLTSQTVVYTVTTTLVPDTTGAASRQSQQSAPAVLKNDQTITLGPLPSSVLITTPPTITATAMSSGVPNGLQVVFGATGSCSIGSQSIVNNISSATVALNSTGSCTVTASQPGTTAFNAANAVSGTFMVLPQGSGTQSQTINFALLPNAQYGTSFSLSASSSSGLQVSFTASGPCATNGSISGIGTCSITASAPASNTYSAASLTQSFTIFPAVLKVTATSLTKAYGQPLPSLTYSYSGFVKSDTAAVVSGAPALSTTATATSNVGSYPITVSTGTLATSNYSFLYVSGTLTVQPANQSALTLKTTSPLTFNQSETLSVVGGTTNGTVTYAATVPCTIAGAKLTATSGTGTCNVTATMAGNSNYNPVTSTPANIVTLAQASQTITFTTNPPASAAYPSTFTVAATATSGVAVTFTSAGSCSNSGATYTMTSSTGSCSVIANQAGNANYSAAPTVTKTVSASGPMLSVSTSSIDFGTLYLGSLSTKTITLTNTGTAPVTINAPILSIVKGGNSNEFVALSLCPKSLAVGKSCSVTIAFVGGPFYTPQTATLQIVSNAPGSPMPVALSAQVIDPIATFNPTSLSFGTIKHATSSTLNVTLTNTGATPLNLTGTSVTGTNAAYFTQTNACGSSLAAGAKCTIAVKFTPAVTGTFSANLTVVDNAQSGTQTVPLSGKGN